MNGFYDTLNDDSMVCERCRRDCLTCNNDLECTTCSENSSLDSENFCICDIGFYDNLNEDALICEECHPLCRICTDKEVNTCLECVNLAELISEECRCIE